MSNIIIDKIKPSVAWAKRAAELQTLQWDKWLNKVNSVIREVKIGDDLTSDAAKDALTLELNRSNYLVAIFADEMHTSEPDENGQSASLVIFPLMETGWHSLLH